ncbi:uncharacterized protein PV07_10841 [Cladophialophora immunda]|uniref:Major facilitator superfamily (MFS) profile domain-containing protein n=1 Tax=Cladophialophora immunda TaxID=569365 RepID=A0A0D2AJU7_9EURO|nr:uncharacterized protein PV07_10841 [Cladophialophora immunda]KIW25182.1 hypothetical protein PV07_10841 [Cladophialophora immunda]
MAPRLERRYVSKLVPSSEFMLFIVIVGTSFADSVLTGYDSSLMGSLNVMPSYKSYFTLTTATTSLNTASSYLGGCIGAFFAGHLTDWLGRRRAIWSSSAITLIGAAFQAGAVNITMFIIGRIIVGIGMAVAVVATPTYVVEVARMSYRGFALGLYYSCWNVGTLMASGICYATNDWISTWGWRLPSLLQIVPSLFAAGIVFFIPESPRWLIGQDRHGEALEVLAIVNSGGDKEDPKTLLQFREISDTIRWEKTEGRQLTLVQAWTNKSNRKRLLLAATFSIVVMLCGNNTITFYFGDMMTKAGITDSTTQLEINIILTSWGLVISVVASWYTDRLPRKGLACTSLGLLSLFMFALAGMTAKFGNSTDKSGIYGTIAMIFLCKAGYDIGINPLTVLYPAEVLSYQIRATGMGLYALTTKMGGLVSTMAIPFSLKAIGWKTYLIFGSVDILYIVLIAIFWVETRGLTLEAVDVKFGGVKHSDVPDLGDLDKADTKITIEGVDLSPRGHTEEAGSVDLKVVALSKAADV